MTEFETERSMPADADTVFAVASDLERLTEWLPHSVTVRPTDDGAAGKDVTREVHADVEPRGVDTHGLVRVRSDQMRVEWGGEASDYAGYLQVMGVEPDQSSVLLHLSFLGDQPETRDAAEADEVRGWLDDGLEKLHRLIAERTP
ncbi:MAG: SRPBCC family protein [Pseudonocardia sp.]|nr:SRPBCC family protein [Pseudonocardia sp.]